MADAALSRLQRRIDAGAWPLAVGDILALALVFSGGTARHTGLPFVLDNPAYLAGALAPFLIGWTVVAPLAGAYSPGAAESAKAAVPLAVRAWLGAALVALALRASPAFHGGVQLSFAVVTLAAGAVGVTAWRWLFFRVRG